MKGITIPIDILSFRDLVQQALDYLRRDLVTVKSLSGQKSKKIDRTVKRPWHLLPSIRGFRIQLSPNDWLLELFGLKKRFPNKMEFKTGKNDKANAYVDYMFKRLRTEVSNEKYDEAVATIGILMNSSAYQVIGLNHVLTNGHRKIPYKDIKHVMKDVRKLVKRRAVALKYARVYLHEKTKIRPLGVPAISGRIYLHMYNNCLVEGRNVTETGKQHGYLPGKGVITAGFAIAKKLNSPNIYEADYKGFFNNVTHIGIYRQLEKMGFPLTEALFIGNINNSVVQLTNNDEIDEPHRAFTIDASDPGKMGCGTTTYQLGTSFETGFIDLYEMGCFDDDVPMKGVPQGAPTSCSIATLALREIEEKYDVIIYADDIIYFPSSSDCDPVKDLSDPDKGLIVSEEKSRGLKKDGKGLVDSFKFLGIRYYPPSGILGNIVVGGGLALQGLTTRSWLLKPARFVAETRKGANLEFSNKESLLSYLAIARELLLDSKYLKRMVPRMSLINGLLTREAKWSLLDNKAKLLFGEIGKVGDDLVTPEYFNSRPRAIRSWLAKERGILKYRNPLTGYFLSKMQSNSGDLTHEQNFTLTYHKQSGVATQGKKYCWEGILPEFGINIFNSSSFAVHDLLTHLSQKSQQQPIRRVYTKSKRAKRWETTVKNLRASLRQEFTNVTLERNYNPPIYSPKWLYSRRPYFIPELFFVMIFDLIIGFPVLLSLGTLLWYGSKKEYFEI